MKQPSQQILIAQKPLPNFIILFTCNYGTNWGFPDGTSDKETACQCRRLKRHAFYPWVGKIPWRRAWQPTPIFLLGESHGQRSLAGYRVAKSWT